MRKLNLMPDQAVNLRAIEAACLSSEVDEKEFALVFEGHQKKIVSVQLTKDVLKRLKDNIDLYFNEKLRGEK